MAGKKWKTNQVMVFFYRSTLSPVLYRALVLLLGSMMLLSFGTVEANGKIPHVGKKAQENWRYYQYASEHKAYAIAPGGAWAWEADALSGSEAANNALENCQAHTQQRCVLYALNNKVVLDREKWPSLWSPYADKTSAEKAITGRLVGQRFYDIRWQLDDGIQTVADLKGKVVFLHFWGSWCPPCLREFPDLQAFHDQLEKGLGDQVAMVFLQVREPFMVSQQWAFDNGFNDLPLADSGVVDDSMQVLSLADGQPIQDREIARVFPSTYILDKHGLVLFSHYGPVSDWGEYYSFIEHVVMNQDYAKAESEVK